MFSSCVVGVWIFDPFKGLDEGLESDVVDVGLRPHCIYPFFPKRESGGFGNGDLSGRSMLLELLEYGGQGCALFLFGRVIECLTEGFMFANSEGGEVFTTIESSIGRVAILSATSAAISSALARTLVVSRKVYWPVFCRCKRGPGR